MSYVYQMSLGKANDETKKFELERDLVFTEEPISKESLHEISNLHKCDVMVSFLGRLVPPSEEELFDYRIDYHTKKMLKEIRKKWSE